VGSNPAPGRPPGLTTERELWAAGHRNVVGVDEVGRGSWAGPISVGAAVLPLDRRVYGVRDSKALSEATRERLFCRLAEWCATWAVGHASQAECDALGMSGAQRLAARRAIEGLAVRPEAAIVDGNWNFLVDTDIAVVRRQVRADATCLSVATASVLAKVTRDRIMRTAASAYPGYDFEFNKGYPCPRHTAALAAWGPTTMHRRAWVFMDSLPWAGVARFVRVPPPGPSELETGSNLRR